MEIIKNVKEYILKHQLARHGDTVLLGVSGGPDSVAMVYILNALKHELGVKLILAHYNHNLRKSAIKDQKFVESLSDQLNLQLIQEVCPEKITKMKGSVEELAREYRFQFFINTAKKLKVDCIALAHTKDDLSETVLMRILRGTGLQGLRSILPIREMYQQTFIRPLLNLTKQELLTFLNKGKHSYCIDPTNKDTLFLRNKIRQKLIPLLEKEYNPNIQEILANLSETITCDYDYLQAQGKKSYQRIAIIGKNSSYVDLPILQIIKQPPAIQRMIFRFAVIELKGDTKALTLKHIHEIETLIAKKPSGSIVNLPQELHVKREASQIRFFRQNKQG